MKTLAPNQRNNCRNSGQRLSINLEDVIAELEANKCGNGKDEKDPDINDMIGTKASGYARSELGPFECEHCLHYTSGGKESGFCDNTHILKDPEMEDGKCNDNVLKVVGAHACCTYFNTKKKVMKAAAELPELIGFTPEQEKELKEHLVNIPIKVLKLVTAVKSCPELDAVHGRFDDTKHVIEFNPANFDNKSKFGTDEPVEIDEYVVAHEFGHALQESLDDEDNDKWKALSGWVLGTKVGQAKPYRETRPGWPKMIAKETHSKTAKFVREYSKKSNKEDFADCCAYMWTGNSSKVPEEKATFIKELLDTV